MMILLNYRPGYDRAALPAVCSGFPHWDYLSTYFDAHFILAAMGTSMMWFRDTTLLYINNDTFYHAYFSLQETIRAGFRAWLAVAVDAIAIVRDYEREAWQRRPFAIRLGYGSSRAPSSAQVERWHRPRDTYSGAFSTHASRRSLPLSLLPETATEVDLI